MPLDLNQINFCRFLLKEIDFINVYSTKYKVSFSHALRECVPHFMIDRLYEPRGLAAVCAIIARVNSEPLQSYDFSINVIDDFLCRLSSEDKFIKENLLKLKEDKTVQLEKVKSR